jgi:hypothetical protein
MACLYASVSGDSMNRCGTDDGTLPNGRLPGAAQADFRRISWADPHHKYCEVITS